MANKITTQTILNAEQQAKDHHIAPIDLPSGSFYVVAVPVDAFEFDPALEHHEFDGFGEVRDRLAKELTDAGKKTLPEEIHATVGGVIVVDEFKMNNRIFAEEIQYDEKTRD